MGEDEEEDTAAALAVAALYEDDEHGVADSTTVVSVAEEEEEAASGSVAAEADSAAVGAASCSSPAGLLVVSLPAAGVAAAFLVSKAATAGAAEADMSRNASRYRNDGASPGPVSSRTGRPAEELPPALDKKGWTQLALRDAAAVLGVEEGAEEAAEALAAAAGASCCCCFSAELRPASLPVAVVGGAEAAADTEKSRCARRFKNVGASPGRDGELATRSAALLAVAASTGVGEWDGWTHVFREVAAADDAAAAAAGASSVSRAELLVAPPPAVLVAAASSKVAAAAAGAAAEASMQWCVARFMNVGASPGPLSPTGRRLSVAEVAPVAGGFDTKG